VNGCSRPRSQAGVTLIEMLIVAALISLVVGIMFPAVTSGLDSLRLQQASDAIAGFINSALNRAERRQVTVEVTVDKAANLVSQRSTEAGFLKQLEMPDGVHIVEVLPEQPENNAPQRHFLLYPGGAAPRFGVVIENRKLARRIVRLDPVTGAPDIERVAK
jgi:prepilin-type N-terminal cleavage/methylation domain-containing protein